MSQSYQSSRLYAIGGVLDCNATEPIRQICRLIRKLILKTGEFVDYHMCPEVDV